MSSSKKITLKSSEGELFDVEEAVALQSKVINLQREDGNINEEVFLPLVPGKILAKVIEYCKKHVYAGAAGDNLKSWDADFVVVDNETLFELMKAANYLNIASLLDLTCQTMADLIAEKSPEEIRLIFNIKSDYTPEEEEEIRKKNAWAYI